MAGTFIGMKKFANIETGEVFVPISEQTIKEMENSNLYEETETIRELTVKEIKSKLDELGIEYNKKANKETLLALLPKE